MEFARGAARARPRAAAGIRRTCRRGSRTGSTASPATGASAVSDSSACRSRSGIACARTAPSTTTPGSCPQRIVCRSIRRPTCPRLHRRPARSAGRVLRRSGHHGHLGDVVAHAADRRRLDRGSGSLRARVPDGRPSAGARHHPDVALLDVLRAEFEHGSLPWKNAAISGWVLDPDRKKMSKSKGNVVTPMALLEEHGSDGVRYWAASGRPGADTAFDSGQMKVGRRLAIKLLNASKFVLAKPELARRGHLDRRSRPADAAGAAGARVDRGSRATINYTRVLERTETFFWFFCDDYLELVKSRRYGDHGEALAASANGALLTALSVVAAAVRAVPAVCDRGSLVVVAARVGPQGRVADRGRDPRASPAAATIAASQALQIRGDGARRHPQEEVRGAAAAQDAGRARRRARAGGQARAAARRRAGSSRLGAASADRHDA